MIVDGTSVASGSSDIGFVINASDSILRGLTVTGFGIGVEIPNPTDVGDLIQGDSIGEYLAYPVDPSTGLALSSPNTVELLGSGNSQQGIVLGSLNTTVGGTDPQDSNVIGGNGMQGILIEPGASGNQVLGNQIGLIGPASSGPYFLAGNGAEGILIEASSNSIGGALRGRGQPHLGQRRRRRPHRGRRGHAQSGRGQLHRRGPRRRLCLRQRPARKLRRRRLDRQRTR